MIAVVTMVTARESSAAMVATATVVGPQLNLPCVVTREDVHSFRSSNDS